MGGGQSGSSTTTTKADPWTGQQPYLTDVFQQAQQNYQTAAPQYYPGSTVAPLSDTTNAALGLETQRALNGSPLQNAANQQVASTMNGDYLYAGSNPYLTGALQDGFDQSAKAYSAAVGQNNSGAEAAGRYGSGAQQFMNNQAQDTLARNVTNQAAQAYANNYTNERTNQARETMFVPQLLQEDYRNLDALANVGAFQDQRGQDVLNADVSRFNYAQNLPWQQLQAYNNLIQGSYGSSGTSTATGTQGQNRLNSALGGASVGSTFGPLGAGIGGVAGLLGFL